MFINNVPTYIGTSGYNHEDWKGNFAPKEIHNYDLLSFYADAGFNFLELAFTFYRMPEVDKIEHILKRTGDRVTFSIRLPRTLIRNPEDEKCYEELMKGIAPIVDRGLLGCVYADYHPSFSVSKKNQEGILILRERFNVPFFAELANRTWYKTRIFEYFQENDIGMTVIDMPSVKGFAPYYPIASNNNLYFKLYGRSSSWLTTEEKFLDYSYTTREINQFIRDASAKAKDVSNIFTVFANVADGQAPLNALKMMEMLHDNRK